MYTDILCRLRSGATRKRPEICRTNSQFLLHDNAPAHRSALVLAKNNVTVLEHLPCYPDLPPADVYQFPRL